MKRIKILNWLFSLVQRSENLFNPNTIISYEFPNYNFVTPKVSDTLHRYIVTFLIEF